MKTLYPLLGVFLLSACLMAQGQSSQESLMTAAAKHLVAVEVIFEIDIGEMAQMMGMEDSVIEQDVFGAGVIVSSNGLIAVGSDILKAKPLPFGMPGAEGPEAELISLKVIGADKKSHKAKVVGKSTEYGVTFLRLEETRIKIGTPLPKNSSEAKFGVDLIAVGRLAKANGYAPYITRSYVSAKVTSPVDAYVPQGLHASGELVLNKLGKFVGITVKGKRKISPEDFGIERSSAETRADYLLVNIGDLMKSIPAPLLAQVEKPSAAGERLVAIRTSFEKAREDFGNEIEKRMAKNGEEETFAWKSDNMPTLEKNKAELKTLITNNPKDSESPKTLDWLVQLNDRDLSSWAVETIFARYPKEECANTAFRFLSDMPSSSGRKQLENLIKNSDPEISVRARLARAKQLLSLKEAIEMGRRFPEEESGQKKDPAEIESSLKSMLKALASDPQAAKTKAGKRTVAATASRILKVITQLKVGKLAPEIEGEDLDGAAFKLSDYRGKVVLLDFWGTW